MFKKKIIFLFLFSIHQIVACKSGSLLKSTKENITTPSTTSTGTAAKSHVLESENLANSEQLTFSGDNRFASVSPDNSKILFASRLRSQHKEFQIYELQLIQNKEGRLIFNDGSSIEPVYSENKTEIFFASTTDEIKEFQPQTDSFINFTLPFSIYSPSTTAMNLEIYSLTITDKKNIPIRLTEHPGYDANPQPLNNKDFFWVQKNANDFKLLKWVSKTKKIIEIVKQAEPIWKATWNNSLMYWAWISWGEESPRKTKIYTLNGNFKNISEKLEKPKALSLPEGIYHDISWVPHENRLLLSAQLKNSKDFDIYLFDLKEQCLRPLVLNPGDDIEPTINSKNSFIVYSHKSSELTGNHFQLYKKNLNPNQEPCLTASN